MLIGTIVAVVLAAALGGASLVKKTYVGEALIQLKFDGDGAVAGGATGSASASVDAAAIVEGEAEIIRSRAIARRVASSLPTAELRASDDHAREGTSTRPSADTATAQPVSAVAKAWSIVEGVLARAGQSLSSPPIPALDREILDLQRDLVVKNDGKSYLIRVSYSANDPAHAAAIANAFAEAYLQSRVEVSVNSARRTSEWLASQVLDAKDAVARAETRVGDFRRGSGVAAADVGDVQTTDKQLGDLIGQLSNARLDRLNLDARLSRLREAAALGHTPSVLDLAGSADAQRLIEAEVTARQEASRLASTLGTKHPLYARATIALQNAKAQLANAVTAAIGTTQMDVASAEASERSLAGQLETAKQASFETQAAAKHLKQLDTEADTARSNLERLQESYRQAQALADLKPIAAQMVSPAEPLAVPASPKMSLVLILSGMGGLALSLLLVFLLELRDTGFHSAGQIVADLGARCIGMIPAPAWHERFTPRRIREQALRSLAITAGLTKHRGNNAVIVITSAVPGEGKTELVRGLALTLANLDRRVLTIENSGRRPRDRAACADDMDAGRSHQTALTTMVRTEGGAKVAGYYRSTTDLQGVFESHDRLQSWLDENSVHFDIVIVEAPPVLTNAEALVIARMADLVLLAVRWNSTPKAAVASAYSQISWSPNIETAVVLNQVDLDRHRTFGLRDSLYFYRRYIGAR